MKKVFLAILVVLLTAPAISAESFDYSAYKPSSIQGIIDEHHDTFSKDLERIDLNFSGIVFKYRINVEYTKKLRKIDPDKIFFLEGWVKSFQYDPAFIDMYKHEILVRADGKDYWIPVQEQLLPYMKDELTSGAPFDLYIAFIGTAKGKWVFLATEFNAP